MSYLDEVYANYLRWVLSLEIPGYEPMNPLEYEKEMAKIPTPKPNKIDAILMNNNPEKD